MDEAIRAHTTQTKATARTKYFIYFTESNVFQKSSANLSVYWT